MSAEENVGQGAMHNETILIQDQYPNDDPPEREYYWRLASHFSQIAAETIESLQEEAAIRALQLSNGQTIEVGPRKIQDMIIVLESRSGLICEKDDQGANIHVTFPEKDKRGRLKRDRFFTGARVEAITMDVAGKSVDLRERGRDPKDVDIKTKIMSLAKEAGDEAQRKGDEIDRKIVNENFKYHPPFLQKPVIASVRLEREINLDIDLIGRLTSAAYAYCREKGGRGIAEVKVQLARFTEHVVIARGRGCLVDQIIPRTALGIYVKSVKGSEAFATIRGSFGTMEECLRRYLRDGDNQDLFAIVQQLSQRTLAEIYDLDRAEGAGILGSKAPIILSPQVAGVFAHECFGHPAEGDIIRENFLDQSAQIKLKSRLGSQVSDHPRFSVIDTPEATLVVDGETVHRFNWGSYVIDAIGEQAKVCTIVENGHMVEAMTDLHCHEEVIAGLQNVISRMNNRGLSGSSRRENYSMPALIRMRNTFILPDQTGPASKEQMAAMYQEFKVKKGVYVKSSSGGWVDTRNGTFNIKGHLCYLIENGMVTEKPIKDVNITGKLSDLLSSIGGLGNAKTMHHTFSGFCGKNNQWVPVDGGGPLVFLKEAQIGGGSFRAWSEFVGDYARQTEEVAVGKRAPDQVMVREIEDLRKPEEPQPQIACVLTSYLPFDIMRRVIIGEGRERTTHQIIWDTNKEQYRLVERRDPHGL